MTQVVRRVPQEEGATAVQTVDCGAVSCRVESCRGGIRLIPARPVQVEVYTLAGEQVASRLVSGETHVPLAAGTYVLTASGSGLGTKIVVE